MLLLAPPFCSFLLAPYLRCSTTLARQQLRSVSCYSIVWHLCVCVCVCTCKTSTFSLLATPSHSSRPFPPPNLDLDPHYCLDPSCFLFHSNFRPLATPAPPHPPILVYPHNVSRRLTFARLQSNPTQTTTLLQSQIFPSSPLLDRLSASWADHDLSFLLLITTTPDFFVGLDRNISHIHCS